MSREIKFRAWDKQKSHMTNTFSLDNMCLWAPGLPSICKERGAKESSNIEYMEWTGLHDKNGVEIYEGDICRFGEMPMKDPIVISWEDGCFGFIWPDGTTFQPLSLYPQDVFTPGLWEVIGNIYENPDLLKGEE